MLSDEATDLGVGFDGEKFVVEHSNKRYRYDQLSDAIKYARWLAEKGIAPRFTGELIGSKDTLETGGHTGLTHEEEQEEARRVAEQETRRQIESLDALDSARIASQMITKFDAKEILELLTFFESTAQLYEAVRGSHAKLEPDYRRAILAWYAENTELQPEIVSESELVKDIITRAINQGLSAICKSAPLAEHLENHHPTDNSHSTAAVSRVGTIEKVRSWKEISRTTK